MPYFSQGTESESGAWRSFKMLQVISHQCITVISIIKSVEFIVCLKIIFFIYQAEIKNL